MVCVGVGIFVGLDVSVCEDHGMESQLIRSAEIRALKTRVPEPVISAVN